MGEPTAALDQARWKSPPEAARAGAQVIDGTLAAGDQTIGCGTAGIDAVHRNAGCIRQEGMTATSGAGG
jgi:hypothetical protein